MNFKKFFGKTSSQNETDKSTQLTLIKKMKRYIKAIITFVVYWLSSNRRAYSTNHNYLNENGNMLRPPEVIKKVESYNNDEYDDDEYNNSLTKSDEVEKSNNRVTFSSQNDEIIKTENNNDKKLKPELFKPISLTQLDEEETRQKKSWDVPISRGGNNNLKSNSKDISKSIPSNSQDTSKNTFSNSKENKIKKIIPLKKRVRNILAYVVNILKILMLMLVCISGLLFFIINLTKRLNVSVNPSYRIMMINYMVDSVYICSLLFTVYILFDLILQLL